jgi:hypothetical protein
MVQGDLTTFNPYPHHSLNPDSFVLNNIRQISWTTNETPFTPLVPLGKPFFGPLFGRLNYSDGNLPVYHEPSRDWGLDPAVVEEWVALERNMRTLLIAMMDVSTAPLPSHFRYWALPRQYGYELRYRRHRDARIIASRSRDSFIPLMAALTLMLRIMDDLWQHIPDFCWRERVLERTGIHPQWLGDLEMSAVGDFRYPRVGGIIDIGKCEFRWLLPLFTAFEMPIYLYWGPIIDRPLNLTNHLESVAPSPTDIRHLHVLSDQSPPHAAKKPPASLSPAPLTDLTSHSCSGNSVPPVACDSTSGTAQPNFPPVEKFSGQDIGEDWRSFFARRAKRCVLLAEKESPQGKESRRQKEAHAAKHLPPGKQGARVYIWDDEDGFLIRRAAGRRNYETCWEKFGPNQRRYNSFYDEWDLCEEFDPTDGPEDHGFDDQDGHDLPLLNDNHDDSHSHAEGPYASQSDLQRIHGTSDSNYDQAAEVEVNDTLEDLAYYRFGFVNPIGTVNEPGNKPAWKTVQKWLGMAWQTGSSDPSKGVDRSVHIFFGYLSSASSPTDIPTELYDILQVDADVRQPWNIRVRHEIYFDKQFYIVTPRSPGNSEQTQIELLLSSAASVVEIIRRRWGPDPAKIGYELLKRGIPFNTCIRGPCPTQLQRQIQSHYGGLGYRPQNYRPDYIDYKAYECLRNQFLLSPRGRAAMLAGGIVARLAREVVRLEGVCIGPSDGVLESGICFWDGKQSSAAYWDDKLTEDESDLICGVYRVDTGQSGFKLSFIRLI